MTKLFNCPTCGAPLDLDLGSDPVIRCPYCRNSVVVPAEMRLSEQPGPSLAGANGMDSMGSLLQQAGQLAEVTRLARTGQKIEAIKLYRELTGASLKDSKAAVEAIQAGHPITLTSVRASLPVLNKPAMLEEVKRLVDEGKKTEAIHLYREIFDVSLAEATAVVDTIASGQYSDVQPLVLQERYIRQIQPPAQTARSAAAAATTLGLSAGCFTASLLVFILLITFVPILVGLSQRGGPLFNTWAKINPFGYARLVMTFGGEGTGAGLFKDARLVAVDPQTGKIFVADYSSGRLQIFDPNGQFLAQWKLTADDEVYIQDLDIDRQGRVYVTHSGAIHIFDIQTGQEITSISSYGDQSASFSNLALTEEGGLVAVSRGETLVRFNSDWNGSLFLENAISTISDDSELDTQLAIDGLGNIYALGIFNESVFVFNPQGNLLSRFGSGGEDQGQFRAPHAIAIDNQSRVYISDAKGIQVFASDGRFLDKFAANGFVFGIAINDQNEIFTVSNDQKVSKFVISKKE